MIQTDIDGLAALVLNIHPYPGWHGSFTCDEAPGAIPNGTLIVKQNSDEGDVSTDGSTGVVLGSFWHELMGDKGVMYFIEWTARPNVAIAAIACKVRPA